jgi:uncharacterized protein (DUF433 family)
MAIETDERVKAVARNDHSHINRIVMDPEILVGKPTVRGTRISVELVLKRLAQDLDLESLFISYPRLTREDVQACLEFAVTKVRRHRARVPSSETEAPHASAV